MHVDNDKLPDFYHGTISRCSIKMR